MTEPKKINAKSTTRNRKKSPQISTQRFLPIAEIRNDTILLKNGGFRAILEVEALNFNLKSETEQQGIIAGYQAFVNTLTFPLQIVIRSSKLNIDPYLTQLKRLALGQQNQLLKAQTQAYVTFIEKLIDVAEIMQKHFYVVLPIDASVRKKSMLERFFEWIHQDDSVARAQQRNHEFLQYSKRMQERLELVQTGLANVGLSSRRLETHELIELFYSIYNPLTSQEQHMPAEGQIHLEHTVL